MSKTTYPLSGLWTAQAVGANPQQLPAGPWQVNVPGTLFAELDSQDVTPDFFWRENENLVPGWAERDYAFSRVFEVPPEVLAKAHRFLVCDGLDTLATVKLNGATVGQADNMHRRWRFAVPDLRPGSNQLDVVFASALGYITQKSAEETVTGAGHAFAGFSYLRKAHCNFGWDWGIKLPDLGIWRDLRLEAFRTARIADIAVQQTHTDGNVTVDVTALLERFEATSVTISMTLDDPDGNQVARQELTSGSDRETCSLVVSAPRLWWPNGYGDQPLYSLHITLRDAAGDTDDEHHVRIGLRTIDLIRKPDTWGESFYFNVNGVPVFAKGANWIPEDALHGRITAEGTRHLVESARAAHFNMLRVWGGGNYPADSFCDLCDELGIMVWQDLMYACALYKLTPEFKVNIAAEAEDVIRRLHHHACLAIWCGNNENEWAVTSWGWANGAEDKRADYIEQYERILLGVHAAIAPPQPYWPSSPSCGGLSIAGPDLSPGDENHGDAHYWDVWHGQKPFTDYRGHYHRFMSEFGFQSFPALATVEGFTEPEDRNIFTRVMENHQKNTSANGKILYYLSETFLYPKDFDSLLYVSQLLQAEAIRYGVEHWRRNRNGYRCMGTLYWQLNDNWPVASWASIDYPGRWKALHYAARRFYAPILLSAKEDAATRRVELHVTSDRVTATRGTLTWALMDMGGSVLRQDSSEVEIPALADSLAADLDFSGDVDAEGVSSCLLSYCLTVPGEPLSFGTVTFCPAKHLDLQEPGITVDVREEAGGILITLKADCFAPFVELCLADDAPRNQFGDNYFDLLPGVAVTVDHPGNGLSASAFRERLQVRSLRDSY